MANIFLSRRNLILPLSLLTFSILDAQRTMPDVCPMPTAADIANSRPFSSVERKKNWYKLHASYEHWKEIMGKKLEA